MSPPSVSAVSFLIVIYCVDSTLASKSKANGVTNSNLISPFPLSITNVFSSSALSER